MTQQLTKIYELAYFIDHDLDEVHLEQSSVNSGEANLIKLNRLHIKILAEQMNLLEVNHTARMGQVMRTELGELADAIYEHWGELSDDKHLDLCHLISAKKLYAKVQTVCRIAGCDVGDDGDAVISDTQTIEEGAIGHANAQASLLEV
ncbi:MULTISPECIES: hypothetical protein [unclassified Polynucleobacter]|uniref:hypothetical protein n=1 Tax=unclassified Polynucleobacter TaxID=2640945 RepID=UPI0008C63E5E|nr:MULTISPECIES: hypothetical protein [unclassified Polynucleobacter]OHC10334.1 MAG: hypothetical protein A2X74_00350 [Polynucleobacter sp. GWA2_45_21]HBK44162.1 hypothetical protein [Polynucleobacter sp.]